MSLRHLSTLLRLRVRAGQLLDLEVAEAALRDFGLQGQVALARAALADAGDDLAVDRQRDPAVLGLDAVVVPLACPLGPVLGGQAALPAVGVRPVGDALGAPDAEQVAVAGG